MNSGRLVAEVRYGAIAHHRATKLGDARYFRVRLGKKRMLTCDCGGTVQHRPAELCYDDSCGGCSHIVALFKGDVTMDKRETPSGDYRVWRATSNGSIRHIFFVRLTELGQKMFFWRWTAKALETP